MRVCCLSDLHGRLPPFMPESELVAIAGDICPDIDHVGWDPELMKLGQMDWLRDAYYEWEGRLPATVESVVATPGNHDWISAFPSACRSKLYVDELVEIHGKKLWFTPWVSFCGPWNYQLTREQRRERFDAIPYKLDLLVMHAPAHGVGDVAYNGDLAGCYEMRAVIQQKQPRHVIFGHIHEGQRYGREFRLGGSKLYNVAMWGTEWGPLLLDI